MPIDDYDSTPQGAKYVYSQVQQQCLERIALAVEKMAARGDQAAEIARLQLKLERIRKLCLGCEAVDPTFWALQARILKILDE